MRQSVLSRTGRIGRLAVQAAALLWWRVGTSVRPAMAGGGAALRRALNRVVVSVLAQLLARLRALLLAPCVVFRVVLQVASRGARRGVAQRQVRAQRPPAGERGRPARFLALRGCCDRTAVPAGRPGRARQGCPVRAASRRCRWPPQGAQAQAGGPAVRPGCAPGRARARAARARAALRPARWLPGSAAAGGPVRGVRTGSLDKLSC